MKSFFAGGAIALAVGLVSLPAAAQNMPFGTEEDTAYAGLLWDVMVASRLAGDNALMSAPYDGSPPHGKMLETFYTTGTINGYTGKLIIKRNYGPEGVDAEAILADPGKHLGSITVMFKREAGYDEDNANWFWVKYLPDGSLDKNPKGMALAGRVAKGATKGCIACHKLAGDYVYTTDVVN
jgi:hypothetical protein